MTIAAAPTRPRFLAHVARLVSWPLTAALFIAGIAWRAIGLLPRAVFGRGDAERGFAEGVARMRDHALGAVRYLGWRSDRMPPPMGRVPPAAESPGPWHEARRRLARNRLALLAWIGIVGYLFIAIGDQFGFVAAGYDRLESGAPYASPGGLGSPHVMGTDQLGADVAAVGLRGVLTALWIGTISALLACLLGTILGALAGYFGKWVDAAVVWLFTTLESIPELLLLLSFAYVLRKNPTFTEAYATSFLATHLHVSVGLFTIVLAIGCTSWVGVCRTVRAEFIRHRDRDYVTAAKALGVPTHRVLFRHILPNVFHLVLISFSLLFVGAIKSEVILSFLGIGLDAGEPSWGQMINHAKLELTRDPAVWWQLATATGLMFGLVLCVNLFADGLRDALDPRLKS